MKRLSIRSRAVLVTACLLLTSCGGGLSADSSCLDYLNATQQERAEAVLEIGLESSLGSRARNPMAFTMVDARCSGSQRDSSLFDAIDSLG